MDEGLHVDLWLLSDELKSLSFIQNAQYMLNSETSATIYIQFKQNSREYNFTKIKDIVAKYEKEIRNKYNSNFTISWS